MCRLAEGAAQEETRAPTAEDEKDGGGDVDGLAVGGVEVSEDEQEDADEVQEVGEDDERLRYRKNSTVCIIAGVLTEITRQTAQFDRQFRRK